MNTSIQHLKVDQTVVSLENNTIFISNINIPERYLDNVRPVLERAYNFLLQDYRGIPAVRYQLTATYELINRQTGDSKRWCGSFMPRENNLSSIDTFHILGPNFINRLEPLCDRQSVISKLSLHGADTVWEFHTLLGLVITVQAPVSHDLSILTLRNLKTRNNGKTRTHITFPLP